MSSAGRGRGGGGAGGTPQSGAAGGTPLGVLSAGRGRGGGGAGGTPPPGAAGGTPPAQPTQQLVGEESVVIIGLVIHATHDIAPYPEGQTTPTPFMYWDSIAPNAVYSEKAVATALIKRLVVVFMSSLIFSFRYLLVLVYKNQRGHENNKTPLYQCSCKCLFLASTMSRFYLMCYLMF